MSEPWLASVVNRDSESQGANLSSSHARHMQVTGLQLDYGNLVALSSRDKLIVTGMVAEKALGVLFCFLFLKESLTM